MENTALILVDLQNDYFSSFKDAKFALNKTEEAAFNALRLLNIFREKQMKIIHIKHEFETKDAPFFLKNSKGAKIHKSVQALKDEDVILKHHANSFKNTRLKKLLDDSNIANVIIVGAMSHMCVDALTRAASDFDYKCFIAHDACSTKDLEFNGIKIKASLVHASVMAALEFAYAKVNTTDELIKLIKE